MGQTLKIGRHVKRIQNRIETLGRKRHRTPLGGILEHIGHGRPVAFPLCSLDLSSLDFFPCGVLKGAVYEIPIESDIDLVTRIVYAVADIQANSGVLERVHLSMFRRCNACIFCNGGNFEHFV